MIVRFENARIIGTRQAVGKDGVKRTYGSLYTNEGELMQFSSLLEISDSLEVVDGSLNISCGRSKGGEWFRVELIGLE